MCGGSTLLRLVVLLQLAVGAALVFHSFNGITSTLHHAATSLLARCVQTPRHCGANPAVGISAHSMQSINRTDCVCDCVCNSGWSYLGAVPVGVHTKGVGIGASREHDGASNLRTGPQVLDLRLHDTIHKALHTTTHNGTTTHTLQQETRTPMQRVVGQPTRSLPTSSTHLLRSCPPT